MSLFTLEKKRRSYWVAAILWAEGAVLVLGLITSFLCFAFTWPDSYSSDGKPQGYSFPRYRNFITNNWPWFLIGYIALAQMVILVYLRHTKAKYGRAILLITAAEVCDVEEVDRLLNSGIPASAAGSDGSTALHVRRATPELIKLLLANGADPNSVVNGCYTPLHTTISTEVTSILLDAGADPTLACGEGPALWCHYKLGNLAMAELMATCRGSINKPVARCGTLLHCAQTVEQAEQLFTWGADPNVPAPKLKFLSDLAGNANSQRCIIRGRLFGEKVQVEGSLQHMLEFPCDGGGTPLHYAVCRDSTELTQLMLSHAASLSVQDICGGTPLHYAQSGSIAKILLEKGADPNAKMLAGLTALHLAVLFQRIDVVTELLAGGADPNALTEPLSKTTVTDYSYFVGQHTTTYSYTNDYVRFLPIIFAIIPAEVMDPLFTAFRYPVVFDLSDRFPTEPKHAHYNDGRLYLSEQAAADPENAFKSIQRRGDAIAAELVKAGSIPFSISDWKRWDK